MTLTLEKTLTAPEELAAALAALERGGAITPVSLDLADPDISFETWMGLGEVISRVRKASSWWIGDWYIFGGVAYGEEKAAAAEFIAGVSPHTLATIVRTCMYVPKSRRRLNLPFSLHTEVCRLMPEEQERWLKLAEDGDGRNPWTRDQLRDAINFARKKISAESEPVWEGAKVLRQQAEVMDIALKIWKSAVPVENHHIVESELIFALAVALGEGE